MKAKMVTLGCMLMLFSSLPAVAAQMAVVPAYAWVSLNKSSMQAYQDYLDDQNRMAARNLSRAEKIFRSPKDLKVEVVKIDKKIAKVKMSRLDEQAKPVTVFFWTIRDQLILLQE
jgi:hypothetical protein